MFRNQIERRLIKPIVYTDHYDADFILLENGEFNQEFFEHLEVPYWEDELDVPEHPEQDGLIRINLTGESSRPPTPDMPTYVPGHGYMVL